MRIAAGLCCQSLNLDSWKFEVEQLQRVWRFQVFVCVSQVIIVLSKSYVSDREHCQTQNLSRHSFVQDSFVVANQCLSCVRCVFCFAQISVSMVHASSGLSLSLTTAQTAMNFRPLIIIHFHSLCSHHRSIITIILNPSAHSYSKSEIVFFISAKE